MEGLFPARSAAKRREIQACDARIARSQAAAVVICPQVGRLDPQESWAKP